MGIPSFLRPEVVPYTSVEIIPAPAAPAPVHLADEGGPSWLAFLAAPTTGALLDAMLADNARVDAELADAAILHEREHDHGDEAYGSACGAGCGYCGMCS
jgi:hypothetical protein